MIRRGWQVTLRQHHRRADASRHIRTTPKKSACHHPLRQRQPGFACDPDLNHAPFKYHAEHRHHIPKPRYRVTNWAEYDASLKRRGSLTVWFTDEEIQAWPAEPRTTPGSQPHYSALAITTALTMRVVFGLGLRQ